MTSQRACSKLHRKGKSNRTLVQIPGLDNLIHLGKPAVPSKAGRENSSLQISSHFFVYLGYQSQSLRVVRHSSLFFPGNGSERATRSRSC